nr:hypothetical protein [Nanoarchaeota archaeon]
MTEIEELKKKITKLEREIEYNGYYNAYLLGLITKKEFEEISKKFVIKGKVCIEKQNISL